MSIVTTVFDRVACLARCLRSVQHLVFTDLEQIVVSDAPPDPVVAEIARLCVTSPRVSQYHNLPIRRNDWGMTPAGAGLQAATGEYVCFLSDDNAYLPDHFGPLVAALDADPGLGFVYSSCQYAGRRELRLPIPLGAQIDLGQPLFRRAVLMAAFPQGFPFHEFAWDWRVIHTVMASGARWLHVDEPSFIFRLEAYPEYLEALA